MKVFISFSGSDSRGIAAVLYEWLPTVLQLVEPWLSDENVRKGGRWPTEIAAALKDTNAGIVCVTSTNQDHPWLNFEAGAISKFAGEALACTFLHGIGKTDVRAPLGQFQHTVSNDKSDVWKLIRTLNAANVTPVPEGPLQKTFDSRWPALEAALKDLPILGTKTPRREDRELLEELVSMVRGLALPFHMSNRQSVVFDNVDSLPPTARNSLEGRVEAFADSDALKQRGEPPSGSDTTRWR